MADPNKEKPRRGGWKGPAMAVYTLGFLATAIYYVVANMTKCPLGTFRCNAFDAFIEGLIYGLIWPLHWLLEVVEAIAA